MKQSIEGQLSKLRPEQYRQLHQQCLAQGPFKVTEVVWYGQNAYVTVKFQDGTEKTVTV